MGGFVGGSDTRRGLGQVYRYRAERRSKLPKYEKWTNYETGLSAKCGTLLLLVDAGIDQERLHRSRRLARRRARRIDVA